MNKVDTSSVRTVVISEGKLVSFIEAFYRIFKVGIYYPIGHAALDQSAGNCIQQLREISPTLRSIKVEIDRNALLVESAILPDSSVFVKDLRLLLEKLGIRSFEIDITVTLPQLLFFIKKILNCRMQLDSAQSFISFDFGDMPKTIRLVQQEFLVDEKSIILEGSENDFKQNLDDLYIALAQQGLDKQQVEQCKVVLEKLSSSQESRKHKIKGFPNATWDDVQTLLYKIVTGATSLDKQQVDFGAGSDIDVISSIFSSLELTLSDKKSKETIKLLLSHLTDRGEDPTKTVKRVAPSKRKLRRLINDDERLSVSQIEAFIYENIIPIKVLAQINSLETSEELSILLQVFLPGQKKEVVENLEQKLRTVLLGRLTEKGKTVLTGGIIDCIYGGDSIFFRYLLNMVLQSLRESENLQSLDFLVELWGKISSAQHDVLWPFVVNELLVGGKGENTEIFLEATEIASNMQADRMNQLCLHLEGLDAFQKKKVARSVFNPQYVFSYRFFAYLCETTLAEVIFEIIHAGLLDEPQDALFKAIGPLLTMSNTLHRQFTRAYLSQAHLKEPPLALKMAAGQIILEFLQNISEEEKDLPWLKDAIAATTMLHVKGMQEMLRTIVKDKKLGILPTWPKDCRVAADMALKSLKRPSLADLL